MIPFRPIGLQSHCRGVILTNSGLWLDLRHRYHHSKHIYCLSRNICLHKNQNIRADKEYKQEKMLEGCYRVPAVTMVESPILVASSASKPMYLSPARACGGCSACSSNRFPSPPSSMTYSIPKWACRDPTLSRNQLTAPGLVTFSFTQNIPRHRLITGI